MLFAVSYKLCRYLGCASLCGAGWLLVKTLVFLAIIDHVCHGQLFFSLRFVAHRKVRRSFFKVKFVVRINSCFRSVVLCE